MAQDRGHLSPTLATGPGATSKEAHHLRVGAHLRIGIEISVGEETKNQTLGLESAHHEPLRLSPVDGTS